MTLPEIAFLLPRQFATTGHILTPRQTEIPSANNLQRPHSKLPTRPYDRSLIPLLRVVQYDHIVPYEDLIRLGPHPSLANLPARASLVPRSTPSSVQHTFQTHPLAKALLLEAVSTWKSENGFRNSRSSDMNHFVETGRTVRTTCTGSWRCFHQACVIDHGFAGLAFPQTLSATRVDN
ncbi:hypothetical protein OG21DRAFT_359740 [Imleria badia]|nr:hypothetical protein OG21DRAFT_359740 [Imleria badia]